MTLQSSELHDGRTERERNADHIAKYGHKALYSRHTCRNCGLDWTCRLGSCRLGQEGVLCRSCEVEAVLDLVCQVLPEAVAFLKVQVEGESVLSASLKLALEPKLKGILDDAVRIALMERV